MAFVFKSESELRAYNNLNTDKPVIAYMPDWRCIKTETGEVA